MNNKLNLFQRLLAETPPFFKRAQIISVLILAIVAELAKLGVISPNIYLIITGFAGGVALLSQFAKTDCAILSEAITDPGSLLQHIPDILDQVSQIKAVVLTKTEAKVVQLPPAPAVPAADQPGPQQ